MQENSEFKLLTLKEHAEMLKVITELLQPALNDITTLKRSNFYYQIKSLSNNLDYTQQIIIAIGNRIDELENTAWRRFCRWIGGKWSTVCGIIKLNRGGTMGRKTGRPKQDRQTLYDEFKSAAEVNLPKKKRDE